MQGHYTVLPARFLFLPVSLISNQPRVSAEPISSLAVVSHHPPAVLLPRFVAVHPHGPRQRSFRLRSVASARDESTQVSDWKVEREVHGGKQLYQEQVPAQQTSDESDTARCMLEAHVRHARADLEEKGGEAPERGHECGEDEHEDDVGPNRTNHVHEAQNTHVDMEVGEGRGKGRVRGGLRGVCWVVGDGGVEIWCQSSPERQPEGTE